MPISRRLFVLGLLPGGALAQGLRLQPRALRFPRDHGAHPEWRTEWWYLTGHLQDGDAPIGFQITFFRTRVDEAQGVRSRLAARQLLMAHAAITDVRAQQHWHGQRLARWNGEPPTQPGQGAYTALDTTDATIGPWRLWRDAASGVYTGQVQTPDFSLRLQASPTQPLLLQGDQGFSRKGPDPEQASFYVTEPQLAVQATLRQGGRSRTLRGTAWLDHEWSEALLHPDAVGWDWVGMNLDDGSALTVFQLRRADGSALWCGGSWRPAGQEARSFAPNELRLEPLRRWTSPRHRQSYPVRWRVHTPVGQWEVNSLLDDQEMGGLGQGGPVYWEGLSDLLNSQGQRVGRGYLEMTGYAAPLQL